MSASTRQESPTLWGVGCYEDERGRRVPWRISHEEIGRDIGRGGTTRFYARQGGLLAGSVPGWTTISYVLSRILDDTLRTQVLPKER